MALYKETIGDDLQLDHYFLCNYVPLKAGKDELSRSIMRFKNRLQVDLTAWVECSVAVLSPLLSSKTNIVRALGHQEQIANYSPLDDIGVKLAQAMDCNYQPLYLRKRWLSSPLKRLNRTDRIHALKGMYYLKESIDEDVQQFLILDDILTTGTTAMAIAQVIKERYPAARIFAYTLARVDYDLHMNEQASFEGEHFKWEENAWMVREEETVYNELQKLKNKILTDSF